MRRLFFGSSLIGFTAMRQLPHSCRFVICIEDGDCENLEKGKVYRILPDEAAGREGYLRIIDESTEDYLYPESYFVLLDFIDFLMAKRSQEKVSRQFDFTWESGLTDFKDDFSSVDLQHQSTNWR